jgi:hypothetical protein
VLQSVCPLVAQKFEHLEELLTMEILLGGNDVDHLVKLVFLVSLEGLAEISGDVDACAI